MAVTVSVNGRTVVHKDSGGTSIAFPDVCLTPVGSAIVPIPYPNTAKSSDLGKGATTVTADGNPMGHEKSIFTTSTGDEAGARKGVASGTVKGIAEFVSFSFDVSVEGKGVVRAFDQMIHNNKNTPPAVLLQPPQVVTIMDETPEIPEQSKMGMVFLDPFGDPMKDLELEVEADGEKDIKTVLSQGNIFHLSEKNQVSASMTNKNLDFKEEK
jgi:hypothetical protein